MPRPSPTPSPTFAPGVKPVSGSLVCVGALVVVIVSAGEVAVFVEVPEVVDVAVLAVDTRSLVMLK